MLIKILIFGFFAKISEFSAEFVALISTLVLTPHAYHLHLLKAFRNLDISDLLSGEELTRFQEWFEAATTHPRITPVLADHARLEKAYKIYTTGEGPAQALKARAVKPETGIFSAKVFDFYHFLKSNFRDFREILISNNIQNYEFCTNFGYFSDIFEIF